MYTLTSGARITRFADGEDSTPAHTPQPPFGLPAVLVAARASRVSYEEARKTRISRQFRSHLGRGGLCVLPQCRVFAPRAETISVLPSIFAQKYRSSRNALTRKPAIAFGILTEVRHVYDHYANKSTSLRRFR